MRKLAHPLDGNAGQGRLCETWVTAHSKRHIPDDHFGRILVLKMQMQSLAGLQQKNDMMDEITLFVPYIFVLLCFLCLKPVVRYAGSLRMHHTRVCSRGGEGYSGRGSHYYVRGTSRSPGNVCQFRGGTMERMEVAGSVRMYVNVRSSL